MIKKMGKVLSIENIRDYFAKENRAEKIAKHNAEVIEDMKFYCSAQQLHVDLAVESNNLYTTLLHLAVEEGLATYNGNELLETAIVHSHLDTVKYLIEEKGVEQNFVDEHGMTPLFCAVVHEEKKIVEYMLKKGANINAVVLNGTTTVLHIASKHCLLEIVKCLTTMEAEIDVMDSDGNTPLHLAVQDDECQNKDQKLDVVKCLVNSGANISVKNNNGNTVLDIAADNNDVIQYLNSTNKLNGGLYE